MEERCQKVERNICYYLLRPKRFLGWTTVRGHCCMGGRLPNVEASCNGMAHAQKPDFVSRRNGRVHLNRRGRQFSRLLAAEVCASAVVMFDTLCSEVVWRVLATHSIRQFPLHFPFRVSPCAITFQLESTTVEPHLSGLIVPANHPDMQKIRIIGFFLWKQAILAVWSSAVTIYIMCLRLSQYRWPRGLRRRSAAARLPRLWVRIPPGAWMSVCCECCVLSGRDLCDELITRPEESYRLWCVVCDLETSWLRRPLPTGGCRAKNKQLASEPFDHSWYEVLEATTLYCTWSDNR